MNSIAFEGSMDNGSPDNRSKSDNILINESPAREYLFSGHRENSYRKSSRHL